MISQVRGSGGACGVRPLHAVQQAGPGSARSGGPRRAHPLPGGGGREGGLPLPPHPPGGPRGRWGFSVVSQGCQGPRGWQAPPAAGELAPEVRDVALLAVGRTMAKAGPEPRRGTEALPLGGGAETSSVASCDHHREPSAKGARLPLPLPHAPRHRDCVPGLGASVSATPTAGPCKGSNWLNESPP